MQTLGNHEPTADIRGAAQAIHAARAAIRACEPIADRFGLKTIDDAYAVQATNVALWKSETRRIVGRKIGLTSHAVQKQLGVDQPDFGVLFADMEHADGALVDRDRLIQPKVEAEVTIVLAEDCPETDLPLSTLIRRVAYACAAIEVVDSAIADWRIGLFDTIADNASSGVYVLGSQHVSIRGLDLRLCGMAMEKNGVLVSTGVGAACLGHPLQAAVWLARKMAQLGQPLLAGELVMTGALGPMVSVAAGDAISAEIGGLGSVRCRFVSVAETKARREHRE